MGSRHSILNESFLVSFYAGAHVATIFAMKFSKTMDHTAFFDAVANGDNKCIPIFFVTIGSAIIILVDIYICGLFKNIKKKVSSTFYILRA